MRSNTRRFLLLTAVALLVCPWSATAAVMNDYCVLPPFVSASVPPLVMFETGRDHKLYYEAYNDSADLDEDGRIDLTYKHSIDYYGYFDPYKCYQYDTSGTAMFAPLSRQTTKFCSSAGGEWSGNFLNWLTMSRMDVLKKVLYGGHRVTDNNTTTVLERVAIPQDAHSWGKEFTGRLCYNSSATPQYTYSCSIDADCETGYTCTDKSNELFGFAQAGLTTCTAATPGTVNNKMLVVRYNHPADLTDAQENGDDHTSLLSSFSSATEGLTSTFIDYDTSITNFNGAGSKLDPLQDHLDTYSMIVVAEFKIGNSDENWQFMVDSDDGGEVELFTTAGVSLGVVASSYGAHASCESAPGTTCSETVIASAKTLTKKTWFRMVARVSEASGKDGIRVWYNKNGGGWKVFGTTNLGDKMMRTFDISATNQCTLLVSEFINAGQPTSGAQSQDTSKFHMACNTSLGTTNPPVMRLLRNVSGKRVWDWASKERPVCDTSLGTPTDYEVRVKVCDSAVDTVDELDIKKNEVGDSCKRYPPDTGTTWKPVGLMQQYGEGDGTKVCSKTMAKSCNSDAGCDFATEGKCVDRADMYFGMFSTSYEKNLSGGVLRKNIGAILDESNANNGIFQSSENAQGNIILTFDRLKTVGFRYSDQSYQDATGGTCGWITTRPLNEGECRNWGNPIAEMMYESLRYFAGKLTPTPAFTYSGTQDSGLQLSKPDWGYKDGSTAKPLYDIYPSCSKPFILLLSDVNASYDSDQIPGNEFASVTEDSEAPQLGLGGTESSGRTLLNQLAYTIGETEEINGNSWYVGENGSIIDFICSGKTASRLSLIRGMCPEEPTKKGSYYAAAVAYYGRTLFKAKTGKPDVNTFAIALASPFSELNIKTSSGTITFLPTAKSVSGCLSVNSSCAQKVSLTYDATYGLQIAPSSPADASAYCPTNTIVDYYVDDIRYDGSNNIEYALFRINYEDVEQGADHDMDSIVRYEICTATAATNSYGSCASSTLNADQIEVKVFSDYAAGCIDQVMGFVISGTTADGVYLPVKDKDVGGSDGDTPSVVADMPLIWTKEFTVGAAATKTLKNPLWYAAKWGGFDDKNGNSVPDQKIEWASECTSADLTKCNPDNYYPVVNPLKLRQQLNKALGDIMRRVSSGTAASILNNSEGSGANLLQAVFYPLKTFDSSTEAKWVGELHNLWYYLDPFLQNTSIREDTGGVSKNYTLNLKEDRIAKFFFDKSNNKTLVNRFTDANGDGLADSTTPNDTVEPDEVSSLWRAGELLHKRSTARTILTNIPDLAKYTFSGASADANMVEFSTGNASTLKPYLGVSTDTDATNLISFAHGTDNPGGTTTRSRTVTYKGATGTWKLGDIVSSTPKLVATTKINNYDLAPPNGYSDTTYAQFIKQSPYTERGMVFVGANDGMLHAFKLGILKEMNEAFTKSKLVNPDGTVVDATSNLGTEVWAFVPKQVLPYLKYLQDPNYSHVYYVDRTPTVADVSIAVPSGCSSDYSECTKSKDTWRTVLISGMGIGGATKNTGNACASSSCVKTPLDISESGVSKSLGYSSYFAFDVTDPAKPTLLWEFGGEAVTGKFSPGDLGYSTTGPAIIRVSNGTDTTKNGKWFAVFASGPTGPIDTTRHEFLGQSNQQLRLFIVDIGSGQLVRTIDKFYDNSTLPANAFAGTLSTSWIDLDRTKIGTSGYYSDDAMYIGYTQLDGTTWTKGGVLRLNTKESVNPDDWEVSSLISNIGPISTSVTKLQDRKNSNLWIYFGTGRYFFRNDDNRTATSMAIYGVKEPCYSTVNRQERTPYTNIAGGTNNDLDTTCRDSVVNSLASPLVNQTGTAGTAPPATISTTAPGWYVNLEQAASSSLMERVITDPIGSPAGAVFFTTFKPSGDICAFGGDSLIWSLRYDSGGEPPAAAMKGKALMQVSTGAFAEISLSDAFGGQSDKRFDMRRLATPISGVPPTAQGLSIFGNPRPVKRMIHVKEK